jgi:cytochrome P450
MNSWAILLGGSETTSTALSGLFFYLFRYPEISQKLKRYIRESFISTQDITYTKLQNMDYLNACIKEAVRLYPPIASGLPRFVPEGGAAVSGEFLPGGTTVYVSQYPAYHSSHNFTEPNFFIPERWLADADPKFSKDDEKVFQPFSYGPRNCVGKR